MANTISNTDNIIDLRDVIARVEELREELQGAEEDTGMNDADKAEQRDELALLESFLDECKGNGGDEQWNGDWYPVTAIHDDYFESAMDELLEDIGDLPKNLPCYINITVDYDALKMDYTSVEFGGETYWVR